jgi:hypothetical protein
MAAAFFRETLSGERPLDELAAALSARKFDASLILRPSRRRCTWRRRSARQRAPHSS